MTNINSTNHDWIHVNRSRVHNLKDLTVSIPRDSFVVITGLSGSGKSSLAFDTIFAEGQRRYVESLSVYARQFLDQLPKPDVDSIAGLSPTISIQQKTIAFNPRSTVGTITELWDYLRVLFARVSTPNCYNCGRTIDAQSLDQIVDEILNYPQSTKLVVLASIAREKKGEFQKELEALRKKGFVRVRVDGEFFDLSNPIQLEKHKKHSIEVVIDRILMKTASADLRSRITESVSKALEISQGTVLVQDLDSNESPRLFSQSHACKECGISYPLPEPRLFSFNSPIGQCENCEGLGRFPIEVASIEDDIEPEEQGETLYETCKSCNGTRLNKIALNYKINGRSIADFASLPLMGLGGDLQIKGLTPNQRKIADKILSEFTLRLAFLIRVGVGYLSMDRAGNTLSGGESQRIKLATQLGSHLTGVIYVLDEPSIGLHQKDNEQLISALENLRDQGNTVIVVEHDEDTIRASDYILDIGPGAGAHGGTLVASGTLQEIERNIESLTGQYLTKKLFIPVPTTRRKPKDNKSLKISNASENNLQNISVAIPLGCLTYVTGVSGSGKSSLIFDCLVGAYKKRTDIKATVLGLEEIDRLVEIDQAPIGRTPRSNPATYTGVFGFIRELFAQTPEAQIRGFSAGRFSFNTKTGRCPACEGGGLKKIEMHFMPNVYVICETCGGARYNRETLQIKYKEHSIADVLNLTIEAASKIFEAIPSIKSKLDVLCEVGLGYIKLGQSATTLSGGEAQRIRLSKELSKRATGRTLYVLDEPSTGLHFEDVRKLCLILDRLTNTGNTVVVIEHQLDMIKTADHIIDLGPSGGKEGGRVIVSGTPETVATNPVSYTGKYLKPLLK